ncbi:Gfo/Idh/MocA family protein [Eudoraea chungangensis]|uniref:Gfo/Idh/MocA family protein n=1 Tax=Eudoraea chungangensis TaxID=1481905 RepID=UPI0023EB1564|nr:Gfo/Idh/MocA family oxidoreductase [Eudoraea chungangensis]
MKQIGVGFIGAGDIANLHAKAIKELPSAKLVGLWNRTKTKGLQKANEYQCNFYDSVDELLADSNIDAVFILTNMETHCEYTLMAAAAGKDILVEKPAASSIVELQKMQEAVNKAKVKCMPVHNYIYEPGVYRIKKMIENGDLGEIASFYMMYNIHHADEVRARYPGVVRQILTHHSYTMLYLAGKPKVISCLTHTVDPSLAPQENVAMAILKMENGTLSHLSTSFANDDQAGEPWTCIIKVLGTKGSARYSYRDWVIHKPNGPHSQTFYSYPESIKNTTIHFIENVIGKDQAPLSTIEDAISCQKIIEACEYSVENGVHVSFKS